MDITGSVALVTGAHGGIGRAFVADLLKRGAAKVYVTARDTASLADLLKDGDECSNRPIMARPRRRTHQPERIIVRGSLQPTSATKSAQTGHGAMSDLSPLSGVKRKTST